MSKHPMQPIEFDGQATKSNPRGVIRFKGNAIIQYILDHASEVVHPGSPRIDPETGRPYHQGRLDLNKLATMDFPQEDREQFAQLMGYSVCGYNELSYVSDASAQAANEAAETLSKGVGGCRAQDCSIHTHEAEPLFDFDSWAAELLEAIDNFVDVTPAAGVDRREALISQALRRAYKEGRADNEAAR